MWLALGPFAVRLVLGSGLLPLPWAIAGLARRSPGTLQPLGVLWARCGDPVARTPTLRWSGVRLTGPDYELWSDAEGCFSATLVHRRSLGGALCGLMVVAARSAMLLHAATLRWKGGVVLVAGPSGAGKSTFARAHGGRALGSNVALVWRAAAGWYASPLPLTGGGDEAAARVRSEVSAIWLFGAPRRPSLASRVALIAAASAGAAGLPPELALVESFARECPARGLPPR